MVSQSSEKATVKITCFITATSGAIITANSEGVIQIWKGAKVERTLKQKHQVEDLIKVVYKFCLIFRNLSVHQLRMINVSTWVLKKGAVL